MRSRTLEIARQGPHFYALEQGFQRFAECLNSIAKQCTEWREKEEEAMAEDDQRHGMDANEGLRTPSLFTIVTLR